MQRLPARADNLCVTSSAQKQASAARRAENRARGKRRPYAWVRARLIRPGGSYKVTRRCLDRRMFLTPGDQSEQMRNFLGDCLAYTANKYGIQVHAAVMSNHYHIDLTDPHGELVAFKQLFNSLVARGINAERTRFESFWSGDGPCDTLRPSDDETFMDLVYTITSPVKSALMKWSRDWPSFTTADWRFGETRTFKRPGGLFGERSELPDEVSLTLVRPPIFHELDDDALYAKLALAVHEKERELQAEHRAKGRRFMGRPKLLEQGWNRAAVSFEERFKLTPKVAASSKWRRLAQLQLQLQREREREYAQARARWRAGEPAVFPAGTYWLRRFAGVAVAQPRPSCGGQR